MDIGHLSWKLKGLDTDRLLQKAVQVSAMFSSNIDACQLTEPREQHEYLVCTVVDKTRETVFSAILLMKKLIHDVRFNF